LIGVLRTLGLLGLMGGIVVALLAARRLPDAVPAGAPAQIVHIADFQQQPPRTNFVHVRGGYLLPHAALALSEGDGDAPTLYLIPVVDEAHPLKIQMETAASRAATGDPAALQAWQSFAQGKLDYSQVRLLLLSTDTQRWMAEPAVAVPVEWIEGVVRPAHSGLSRGIVQLMNQQFDGVSPQRQVVLYEGELPPEEEALRLLLLLGGLAALLGLATLATTLLARPRRHRR
jgi:hypothetical protein